VSVRQPFAGAVGQHFLRSSRLAAALVADAHISRDDLVVEIGGGTGMLTQALADVAGAVKVVERDHAMVIELRKRFGRLPHVELVEGDAAAFAWPAEEFSLVANVPFARSGAILGHLLDDPCVPLRRADVIVQWEFAAKHAAVWPSTLRSTYWRAWFDIVIQRRLARTVFSPVPSVDAAVLRFERLLEPRIAQAHHAAYRRFLATAFESRQPVRRALGDALSPLQIKRLAPTLGFAPDCRPWDLDAGQWASLFTFAARARGGVPLD
jgi:23S rRNA (adenine-N6)-dimethyltransferase